MSDSGSVFYVDEISKRFGRQLALRSLSCQITRGESVAVLGANGAGKSTLLRILATLSRPTRGRVRIFGADVTEARSEIRARIGVVGHQPFVYPELTCRENLRFFATMYAIDDVQTRLSDVACRSGLEGRLDDRAATLSRGLLQRLDIARAILHGPSALVLDEPDTGLDMPGRRILSQIVSRQIARDGCVVFTSHAIDFAFGHATRIIVLRAGESVLDRPIEDLSLRDVETAISPALPKVAA